MEVASGADEQLFRLGDLQQSGHRLPADQRGEHLDAVKSTGDERRDERFSEMIAVPAGQHGDAFGQMDDLQDVLQCRIAHFHMTWAALAKQIFCKPADRLLLVLILQILLDDRELAIDLIREDDPGDLLAGDHLEAIVFKQLFHIDHHARMLLQLAGTLQARSLLPLQ